MSRGWKKPVIDSRPRCDDGALRYHSSLNARTARRLSTFGIPGGTAANPAAQLVQLGQTLAKDQLEQTMLEIMHAS